MSNPYETLNPNKNKLVAQQLFRKGIFDLRQKRTPAMQQANKIGYSLKNLHSEVQLPEQEAQEVPEPVKTRHELDVDNYFEGLKRDC